MFVVIISRLKRKVLFCLRLLVMLAIFVLLFQHLWAFIKGGPHVPFRDAASYHASKRYDISEEEKFWDRFLKFWRDYYYGRL